jgi:signal transduction histidine kinase
LALATPIIQGAQPVGSFLAVYDLSSLRADQRHVLVLALLEAAVALIAAVLGTYLLLRRLLGTIGSMTSTARAIEEGDLDQRLGDPGTDDEVAELAATLDAMLDRIDEVMSVQRQLLSDVSHQLRTPLTVVRGHLEVMGRTQLDDPMEIREVIDMLVGEIDHMGQLTEQLLLLGRSLEPDFVTMTPTDLRSFIGDIGAAALVLADGRFRLGSIDDLVITIDQTKLRGAILNLIDNAIKAIGPADRVELSARRVDDGSVVIQVEDSGPGISPEVRARVLERFGRLDTETRSGSGLGLAIVRAVAEAHGGTFELGTSSLGGLDAIIVLPGELVTADGRTNEESTQ